MGRERAGGGRINSTVTSITVPAQLVAGDTWSFTLTDGEHTAPAYSATIYFENAGATFNAASADSGNDHAFAIAAATTAAYTPGRYKWFVRVTDGSNAYTVSEGWLEILVNPAATGTHDHRSDARKMLDAINAFLIGNASTAQKAMSINGRSLERHTLPELTQWRDQLRNEVRTEERSGRAGLGRNIKVRLLRG